ncbi:MAG: hypothetical protein GX895_10350 [Clostridiales bacterium]|uniref:LiaF domain-containing protein n=1 Tax=Clostridium sp. N3C TaxID=1776758 RepID=UPI00092E0C84|nr:LiaF domain-containing protein [Clostridium sp. N3C]NLZ49162.1 hypothetical protein [Clostridiales bacterium]SCN24482.1 hypothetical protein N3C_1828 [Clostridium sp. N3C]
MKKLKGKRAEECYGYFNEGDNSFMPTLAEKRSLIFSDRDVVASGFEGLIKMIFSDGMIDLTKMKAPINSRSLNLNLIFSDAKIKVPEHLPILVKINTIFSDVNQPRDREVTIGGFDYVSKGFVDGQPYIEVKIQAFFSDIKIIPE